MAWHEPTCTFEKWTHKDVTVKMGKSMIYVTLNRPKDNNLLSADVILALCDVVMLLHRRKIEANIRLAATP